jgi:hypothetical protein
LRALVVKHACAFERLADVRADIRGADVAMEVARR